MRLKDFEALRQAMRSRERDAALRRERERQAALQRERLAHERGTREQFVQAVGPVHALRPHGRADMARPRPLPHPRQRELDERAALAEALSDEVDVESLLLTDDGLSFRRPGIGVDVVARLRRGQWSIQRQIDLHGLTRDRARDALASFIRRATSDGLRCVRVVHGKGNGSPGGESVLKPSVRRWLVQKDEVLAFTHAGPADGGHGALLVLLRG